MNLKNVTKNLLRSLLATASMASAADSVHIDVAPYLWATSMHGQVQVGPERVSVSQSFGDLMKHFQGGGMLFVNIHKNKWGLFGNALYSVLTDNNTFHTIPIGARNNFGIFSGGFSYTLINKPVFDTQSPTLTLELFAGARFTLNDTKVNLGPFTFKDNQSWTDPIAGARLTIPLKPRLHFIISGDAGGANSHYSYDVQTYLGYQTIKPMLFNNMTLYLGYRFLHQRFASGSGLRYYLWNMDISGPVLGCKTVF